MAEGNGFFAENMTRRRALSLIGGSMAACAAGLRFPRFAGALGRPNIIFILSDDHRWDAMSNMGHPVVQTPFLDRLASQGVRFNNAFVTTSLCSPSRASFLTGQYARTHGVQNNLTPWRDGNVTFLELLKKAGYDTAFIGKWHMPGRLPVLRGVDRFITFTVQEGQGQYFDCPLIVDGREEPSRRHYITEELTDRALGFLSWKRSNPFCIYLSHKAVHHRFLPPPELNHIYDQADQMILNVDLAPTLLEMAGLAVPSAMEGTSLVPLLRDRGAAGRRAWMYEYFKDFPYNTPEHQAVRTRRHKFIQFQGGRPEELYDLAQDPREMKNLIGTEQGVQLRPELAAMLEELRRGARL